MVRLSNFCCCGSLRTGSLIVLWIYMIISLVHTTVTVKNSIQCRFFETEYRSVLYEKLPRSFAVEIRNKDTTLFLETADKISKYIADELHKTLAPASCKIRYYGFSHGIDLSQGLFSVVVAILAIHGVYTGKSSCLVPFLVWTIFYVLIDFTKIVVMFKLMYPGQSYRLYELYDSAICSVFCLYFWLVIYSYRAKLKATPTCV